MAESTKYVEVRLGGGVPQFIPLDSWAATDPAKRAEYTVIHSELTEDQRRVRASKIFQAAAVTGSYADPDAGPAGAGG